MFRILVVDDDKNTRFFIKEALELEGFEVFCAENGEDALAVYDKDTDKYLVGVELDRDAFRASSSSMERDVYKPKFLEARGWNMIRVWCRDWWLYPARVIKSITSAAEKNRETK